MEKYKKLKYSDFSSFSDKQKQYNDGILTLSLASWDEFREVLKIFNNNTDYIWRGQANKEWPLIASIYRPVQNHDEKVVKHKELLNNDERRNNLSLAIWVNQQHYGSQTPLLDWTDCPYIAVYFAFDKPKHEADKVIYALNRAVQRLLLKKKSRGEVLSRDRSVEIIDPRGSKLDVGQNVRLKSQKSKFTNALYGNDVKKSVKNLYRRSYRANEVLLAQIIMPETSRDKCREFLKSQEITSETLFPDRNDAGRSG